MSCPKSVSRPKRWSAEVEEAYRFQLAGYRDENEYTDVQRCEVCINLGMSSKSAWPFGIRFLPYCFYFAFLTHFLCQVANPA